jgi:hypothetical protein
VRAAPFIGGHFEGMRTSHYAGETAEDVNCAEDFDCVGDGFSDGDFGPHVDGLGNDATGGELGVQFLDGGERGVDVDVPEGEGGAAVFEEGAGGF